MPLLMRLVALGSLFALLAARPPSSTVDAGPALAPVTLTGISPCTLSKQTSTPLLVLGRGLAVGRKLHVGAPFGIDVALGVDDDTHGYAVMPAGFAIAGTGADASVSQWTWRAPTSPTRQRAPRSW